MFLLAVYQFRKGISAGPALKYFKGVVGSTDHKIISIDNRRSTIDRNSP